MCRARRRPAWKAVAHGRATACERRGTGAINGQRTNEAARIEIKSDMRTRRLLSISSVPNKSRCHFSCTENKPIWHLNESLPLLDLSLFTGNGILPTRIGYRRGVECMTGSHLQHNVDLPIPLLQIAMWRRYTAVNNSSVSVCVRARGARRVYGNYCMASARVLPLLVRERCALTGWTWCAT